jgi:hypothetical protein
MRHDLQTENPKVILAYYQGYKSGFHDDVKSTPASLEPEIILAFDAGWGDGFAGKQILMAKRILHTKALLPTEEKGSIQSRYQSPPKKIG